MVSAERERAPGRARGGDRLRVRFSVRGPEETDRGASAVSGAVQVAREGGDGVPDVRLRRRRRARVHGEQGHDVRLRQGRRRRASVRERILRLA